MGGQSNSTIDPECEKDFKKAYLKLVEKVCSESGTVGNLLVNTRDIKKVQHK